jgi:hypothetical protein
MTEGTVVASIHVPHVGKNLEVLDTLGRIDFDDLAGEIARTGGEAIFWGIASADAKARANQADLKAKVTRVQVSQRFRKLARELGEKSTEGSIGESTTLDPEVTETEQAAIEAERVAGLIQAVLFAIVQKSKTLGELAGVVRDERAAGRRLPDWTNPEVREAPLTTPTTPMAKKSTKKKKR